VALKTVLFYRDFKRFTGGDLKVWDYFNHVLESGEHSAYVRLSDEARWDESNPWWGSEDRVIRGDAQVDADILFLSGIDWLHLDPSQREESPMPVINLIQHVWHACPNDRLGRYEFLPHKAIRISVSPEVTRALERTGRVNGPLFTIPDAIDYEGIARAARPQRDVDLLIVAAKQPELGTALEERLRQPDRVLRLIDERIPRSELVDWLGRSRVTVFLPNPKEGFYLPALEGMAAGTLVVCPDCIGNRSFCLPEVNCLRPPHSEKELVEAAQSALERLPQLAHLLDSAADTARRHDLRQEREAFLPVLEKVDELWGAA
jgi:glycosyltransferase involved in cell wall biosynthesis